MWPDGEHKSGTRKGNDAEKAIMPCTDKGNRHFKHVFPCRFLRRITPRSSALTAALLAVLLGGCGQEEVRTYRVAPETPPPPRPAAHQHTHAENPHGVLPITPRITYQTPAGWEAKPAGAMRAASFSIPGADGLVADVAVIPMPGTGAPVGEMVNLWRTQLGLNPVEGEAAGRTAETASVGGGSAPLFEFVSDIELIDLGASKRKARIVGVVLPREDTTWFFKLAGEDAQVASQKGPFKEFLQSIEFEAPAVAAAPGAPAAGGYDTAGKPRWTVPAAWKEEPPTQMLIARFTAAENDREAEITVSAFPGDVGGLLANVNRWRRQVGQPPMPESEVTKEVQQLDPVPGRMMLVDILGTDPKTDQPARLVGIIVPQAGQTWFYKLMGDPAVVGAQKEPLVAFAKGVQY